MRVGYIRVSSIDQNLDRQIDLMASLQVEKVFEDKASGKNAQRRGLQEMLAFVRTGDEVVVDSISRLARSTRDFLDIVERLETKGVAFSSRKESIDTKSAQGRFMMTIFAAMFALDRETIHDLQRAGYEAAKARGKRFGRPALQKPSNWDAVFKAWKAESISAVEAVNKLGISKSSFYKLAGIERERAS